MKRWVLSGLLFLFAGGAMASDDEGFGDGQNSFQLVNYAAVASQPSDGDSEDAEPFRLTNPTPEHARFFVFSNVGRVNRSGDKIIQDLGQLLNSLADQGVLVTGGRPAHGQGLGGAANDDDPFVKHDEQEVGAADFDLPGVFDEDEHNWYGRDPNYPGTIYTQPKMRGFGRLYRDDPEAVKNRRVQPLIGDSARGEDRPLARFYHARKGAASFFRIVPPLALATAGVILIELVKGQPLTPSPSSWWPFKHYHFDSPQFFFPTALFKSNVTIGRMIEVSYSYYDAASESLRESIVPKLMEVGNIIALWSPPVFIGIGEIVKATCCKAHEETARTFMCRSLVKGALGGGLVVGGAFYLTFNIVNWSYMFSYHTPKILQQMNLTSAVELCNQNPLLGMAGQDGPNNFYDYVCYAPSLIHKMMPTQDGLVWSLCEKAITNISAGNYAMLVMPLVFILLNWIYLIVWI